MGIYDDMAKIAGALSGKKPQASGGSGRSIYDSRAGDMSTRDANIAKLKTLGLDSMPDGGQEELDQRYAAHLKAQGAK